LNYHTINDSALAPEERIEALKQFVNAGGLSGMPAFTGEINNHIHTIYSFSPYTPAMAALKAREAGLEAAGSVDHDSVSAAKEMREACEIIGLGCVTGFEMRVSLKHTEFANRKINSPDSPGIAYITIQGIPPGAEEKVNAFLKPLCIERGKRNRRMVEALNAILVKAGEASIDYDKDILPLSQAARGGSVTERHILYALSLSLIRRAGKGEALPGFLEKKFGLALTEKNKNLLTDQANPYYDYDLLGVLKSSFNDKIYIQPDGNECPPVEDAAFFARSINAVPAYAYLGDVGESPTGDKKAEKFEDDFLEELISRLTDFGFQGITYMPPRNTAAQLRRLRELALKAGLLEISGVDINSPRQLFQCPEIRRPEFALLLDTTWALAAHEKLAASDTSRGIFNPKDPLAGKPLAERIRAFAEIGRRGIRK
jgi:hypothetical protein